MNVETKTIKHVPFPILENDNPNRVKSYSALICHSLKGFRKGSAGGSTGLDTICVRDIGLCNQVTAVKIETWDTLSVKNAHLNISSFKAQVRAYLSCSKQCKHENISVERTSVSHRLVFNSRLIVSTVQNRPVKQTLVHCWI